MLPVTAAEAGVKMAQPRSDRITGRAISEVSSAGGTPQPLTTLDKQAGEITQRWPQVLPGGKAVLFTSNTHAANNFEHSEIVVYSMASGQRKTNSRGNRSP